jgi:hypothetical protein
MMGKDKPPIVMFSTPLQERSVFMDWFLKTEEAVYSAFSLPFTPPSNVIHVDFINKRVIK